MKKKPNSKYYFSVEGETEKWYLEWLQKIINHQDGVTCKVIFDIKKEINPESRVKGLTVAQKTKIVHVFDYESQDHDKAFQNILCKMRSAEKLGKNVVYYLGYSNFDFELWMILHKGYFNQALSDKREFLDIINKRYQKKIMSLKVYKEEKNFKKLLEMLTISDVINAVGHAKKLMLEQSKVNKITEYKKYVYVKENPATSLHIYIEDILKETGLMK